MECADEAEMARVAQTRRLQDSIDNLQAFHTEYKANFEDIKKIFEVREGSLQDCLETLERRLEFSLKANKGTLENGDKALEALEEDLGYSLKAFKGYLEFSLKALEENLEDCFRVLGADFWHDFDVFHERLQTDDESMVRH